MEDIAKFQKKHECPKCANSYFSIHVRWMTTYVKRTYTCEDCLWSCVEMSSCTSAASVPAPSSPDRSVVSVLQTESR